MCAGYTTPEGWQELKITWKPDRWPLTRRFAVRPFDKAIIVRNHEQLGQLEPVLADQWSLVPPFSRTKKIEYTTYNARTDRLKDSRVWRSVFPKNRCLIPLDGFFERVPEAGAKKNRPYYVRKHDEKAFWVAGLWSDWADPETGEVLTTFTMLTKEPNRLLTTIGHDRMPCILDTSSASRWMDSKIVSEDELIALLNYATPNTMLKAAPVSHAINYRDKNGPETIEPIGNEVVVDEP